MAVPIKPSNALAILMPHRPPLTIPASTLPRFRREAGGVCRERARYAGKVALLALSSSSE